MALAEAKRLLGLAKEAAGQWWADRAMSMGAAIAFYATSSLAPMLLLVISIAGLVLGEEAARGAIVGQISGLVGVEAAQALESMVENAADTGSGVIGAIVGVVTVLILSTGAFVELQDSLNVIWRAEPERSGLLNFLHTRLLSFAMILTIGFLLLVSLVFDAAIAALGTYLGDFAAMAALLAAFNLALSLAVTFTLLTFIYKILPDTPIAWRDVWFGAAVTSALFAVGKLAIGAYLGSSGVASTYGAAGSLIAVLFWVYYSSLILLYGAEITRAHAGAAGRIQQPSAGVNPRARPRGAQP